MPYQVHKSVRWQGKINKINMRVFVNMKRSFFIIALLFLLSCTDETPKEQALGQEQEIEMPEDFFDFYKKFLSDSSYQMEHIIFPLQGIPSDADGLLYGNDYKWEKENWTIHKAFDPKTSGFTSYFTPFQPTIVIEKIQHNSGQFYMTRRFAKMDTSWYLIFYEELQRKK